MTSLQEKRNIFSFSDDEDDDDRLINSVKPLPSNAVERSAFTAPEFDPDSFLSSRRHLGLERMKTELNTHLKLLKTELVELINRDYQDFINLSTNLKGVDKDLENLKSPLANMQVQVKEVRDHFQDVIDALESQLESRARLRDKKSMLKLLLNIHNSVTKVEDLLGINSDTSKSGFDTIESDEVVIVDDKLGKQIERVAIEYNQMQHLVRRGKDLAFVTENDWRITRIKDTLEQKLSNALSAALSQIRLGEVTKATKQSLTQCLRTYALINQTPVAEKIIRNEYIKPYLAKIITSKIVEGPRNYGSPTSEDNTHPLTVMYTKILTFASTDLQIILDITQKTLKGSNFEILVNSLWLEVTERINKECKSIFAAGQTDVFHKNYSVTVSFISGLEGLCYTKRSLLYLRNHPTYAEFMKRWQLLVYFQLRFREIVQDVELVLNDPQQSLRITHTDQSEDTVLAGTRVILSAINRCWSDRVFLYGLSHRFWKLTLQLIKRYNGWADIILNEKANNNDITEYAQILIILAYDINNLDSKIRAQTNDIILPKLPSNVQDLPLLKESMKDVLNQLVESTELKISSSITNRITTSCSETLKLVQSATNQYRHTNKQPPTEPSSFIPNLFKPYHSLVNQNAKWIDDRHQLIWAEQVAKFVITQYSTIVSDILTKLDTAGSTLKKVSKFPKGQMSDEDKIRLQILMDIEQIGNELDSLKIDKASANYYKQLQDITKKYGNLAYKKHY